MLEFYLKKLSCSKVLKDALPKLIEAFVDYYGEEARDDIEKKFNDTFFIGYLSYKELKSLILNTKEEFSKYILLSLEVENNVSTDEKKVLFNDNQTSLDFSGLLAIDKIADYLKYYEMGYDKRFEILMNDRVEYLQRFNKSINRDNIDEYLKSEEYEKLKNTNDYIKNYLDYFFNVDDLRIYLNLEKEVTNIIKGLGIEVDNLEEYIKSGKFDRYIELAKKYEKALSEYDTCISSISNETKWLEEVEEQTRNNNKAMYKKLYDKYREYIGEELYKKEEKLDFCSGSYFRYDGIEVFSQEYDEILKGNSSWRINSIKSDRVRFYKLLGIDRGDNYDDYLDCRDMLPSAEIIEEMIKDKKELEIQNELDLYHDEDYYETLKELQELGLSCYKSYFNANLLKNTCACVCPDVIESNNKTKIYPTLLLSMDSLDEYIDNVLIHELNHRYELSLSSIDDDSIEFLCGWDYLRQERDLEVVEDLSMDEDKRQYELFNEIINEMIAEEITELMHSKGVYIFNTEKNAKTRGGTSYELMKIVVKDFFYKYRKEILESRRDGNIDIIYNTVGRDNFDRLNNLIYKFNENFTTIFELGNAIEKRKKGIHDENVSKLEEIENIRDSILEDMNTYSLQMSK